MKPLLAKVCAGVIAVSGIASAQTPSMPAPTADTARVRAAVLALEQRIGDANFACDYAFFARVEAPEFIFTDPRGSVTTRAEDLAGAPTCRVRKGTYALDDVRLQYHGAVVVFNARATTTVERDTLPPIVARSRFTDVLVWRDTSWVLVAGHSSRIP